MTFRITLLFSAGLVLSACGPNPDALAKDAIYDLCIGDRGTTDAFCDCAAKISTAMMSEDERYVYGELYKREKARSRNLALYSQYADELGMTEDELRKLWRSANRKAMQSPVVVDQECAGL